MTKIDIREWVCNINKINKEKYPNWKEIIHECIIGYACIRINAPIQYTKLYAKEYNINIPEELKSKSELDNIISDVVGGYDNFLNWIEKDFFLFLIDEGMKEMVSYVTLSGNLTVGGLCYGHIRTSSLPGTQGISDPYLALTELTKGEINWIMDHFKFSPYEEYNEPFAKCYISTQLPRNLKFTVFSDENDYHNQKLAIYIDNKSCNVLELIENRKRLSDAVIEIVKCFNRYAPRKPKDPNDWWKK